MLKVSVQTQNGFIFKSAFSSASDLEKFTVEMEQRGNIVSPFEGNAVLYISWQSAVCSYETALSTPESVAA